MNYELCRNNFFKINFFFIIEEIKLNTVIVDGSYISGILAKNMYKSKFTGCKSIQPLRQYLVEAPFTAMTVPSLFGSVSTSFAQWAGEIFSHSSRENCSSSAKFDGDHRWTAICKSRHKCSIGFKSGLWLHHSRTFIFLLFSHSIVALALCFGSSSCWNVNLLPSFRFMADSSKFSSRILLHFVPSMVPSILPSLPVPADEKQPHNMMLPPPCVTVGMVLTAGCAVLGLFQT